MTWSVSSNKKSKTQMLYRIMCFVFCEIYKRCVNAVFLFDVFPLCNIQISKCGNYVILLTWFPSRCAYNFSNHMILHMTSNIFRLSKSPAMSSRFCLIIGLGLETLQFYCAPKRKKASYLTFAYLSLCWCSLP